MNVNRYISQSDRIVAAKQVFSFLEEYGFRFIRAGSNLVRFESGNMFLTVIFNEDNYRIDLSFGPLRGEKQIAQVYDAEDLAELADPPGRLRWRFARARTPELLQSILEGYASLLRNRAVGLLRATPGVFEKLTVARKARSANAARKLCKDLAESSRLETEDEKVAAEVVVGKTARQAVDEWAELLDKVEREAHALLTLSLDKAQVDTWKQKFSLLEPHPLDYERVFAGQAASGALKAYLGLWGQIRPTIVPGPEHNELKVTACLSDWFAGSHTLARRFPDGYRQVSSLLEPGVVWVAWKYVGPGDIEGLAYDGLVWLDNCFAWFPKPFQILAPLVNP